MKLILASGSPRRRELLESAGFSFTIHPPLDEEIFDDRLSIDDALKRVARHKAHEVYQLYPECCVLSADTIVVYKRKRLGKPDSIEQARAFLHALSGHTHEVKTGVCIRTPHKEIVFVDTTKVHFRKVSGIEIENYISRGTCMDKAGAYGIQECDFVDAIDGKFSNVVGLPIEYVSELLAACK